MALGQVSERLDFAVKGRGWALHSLEDKRTITFRHATLSISF
jgi:hypothetical protein